MKDQPQPDPKNIVAPRHGYGPMVAITGGNCGFQGPEPDSTKIVIKAKIGTDSKIYDCGTRAKAQAVVNAVQSNAWIYNAQGYGDGLWLYAGGDTTGGQLSAPVAGVPTIDATNPLKVTFDYSDGGTTRSVAVLFTGLWGATPNDVKAFVQTLTEGGWPLGSMTLDLGYRYMASTGPNVMWAQEAGVLGLGFTLPTS